MLRTALVFATLAVCVQAWPSGIINTSTDVCKKFHVTHCSPGRPCKDNASVLVELKLKPNGNKVDCVNPGTSYLLNISSNELKGENSKYPIKGLLLKQEVPEGESAGIQLMGRYLPKNTARAPCREGHSISHYCQHPNPGCKLGDDGNWLNITYLSPSKLTHDVVFRYTVVLEKTIDGYFQYIQNQTVVFPRCLSQTPSPKTPAVKFTCPTKLEPNETNEAEDTCPNFSVNGDSEKLKVKGKCSGSNVCKSYEMHVYVHNNRNYTCIATNSTTISKCISTCRQDNGTRWCCKNKISRTRKRTFTCEATKELNPGIVISEKDKTYTYSKKVLQTKRCQCFKCEDTICEHTKDNVISME